MKIIRRIPIDLSMEDKYVWHYDRCGNYSVKSGYSIYMKNKIRSGSSNNSMAEVWMKLRKLKVPAKVKHFCWRALNDFIPTKVNLHRRGIQTERLCPRCEANLETTDHILVRCSKAQEIWNITFAHDLLKQDFNQSFVDRWFAISSSLSPEDLQMIAVTCWAIWSDRNSIIHNKSIPPNSIRSSWIKKYVSDYLKANESPQIISSRWPGNRVQSSNWRPPSEDRWKFNVDAAWKAGISGTGIGVVCRNSRGKIQGARAVYNDLDFLAPMPELKAIVEGLKFAESMNCMHVLVESDCLQAINLVLREEEVRNELGTLVDEIKRRVSSFSVVDFSFSQRNSNLVSDAIAKWARDERTNFDWVQFFPEWLCNLVFYDQFSAAHVAL